MKKAILAITIALVTLSSCSKDSENNTENTSSVDPIIGSWKLTADTSENISTREITDNYTACDSKSIFVFEANGNGMEKSYQGGVGTPYPSDGSCSADLLAIKWKNAGQNTYTRTEIHSESSLNYTETLTVTFSSDKKRMYHTKTTNTNVYQKTYSKEDELKITDPRDELVGSYTGKATITKKYPYGPDQTSTENISLEISKSQIEGEERIINISKSGTNGNIKCWSNVYVINKTADKTTLCCGGINETYIPNFQGGIDGSYDSALKKLTISLSGSYNEQGQYGEVYIQSNSDWSVIKQ